MSAARWGSAALTGVFATAALLQWNDPDPLVWFAAYAASALLAARHALGKDVPVVVCAATGLVLGAWALSLSPSVLAADAGAYTAFAMQDRSAEEARECIGLGIAAGYLGWLTLASQRTRGLNAGNDA